MKSDTASFSVAPTLQTSCMQKCSNSQGGHKPTAQVCDLASPNALGKGDCGEPWVDGGDAPGPAMRQNIDQHSLFRWRHLSPYWEEMDVWCMWDKPEHI